jgi:hypothetical protein
MSLTFIDRYESTLSSPYTSGGGSLVVTAAPTDGSVFPYWVVVEAEGANTEECFKVTARTTTTLTVTGAQFNTAASDHASGAVIKGAIMGKAAFEEFQQNIIVPPNTYANLPAAALAGRIYYPTDSPYGPLIDDGSNWDHFLPQLGEVTPPVNGDYSWDNDGGVATVVTTYGGVILTAPAASGQNMRVRHKSAPSPPYTITTAFKFTGHPTTNSAAGILFRQSSDGKLHALHITVVSGTGTIWVRRWTDSQTFAGVTDFSAITRLALPAINFGSSFVHMKIEDDNSNRKFYMSGDGRNWVELYSVGRTTFLTADQVGFWAESGQTTGPAMMWLLDWTEG